MAWNMTDTWIVVAGVLCAVACALLGNFMVLRRLSMMGDAISHAVLPGLVGAFLVTGTLNGPAMFVGAVLVGVLTALLVQGIHHYGKVEESAAMGVVFTTLFAIGLLMIVRWADSVDLDEDCVLYGAIEYVPLELISLRLPGGGLLEVPETVLFLAIVVLINLAFVVFFFKELRLSAFDPDLGTTVGVNAQLMHYLLMVLVALTAVAAFESVGSILVIAMLIVPGATALLLTDRLHWMVVCSAVVAALSAVLGHVAATLVPAVFGFAPTTTSGMMAATAGALFLTAVLLAPRHGVLAKLVRRCRLSLRVTREDIIGLLYRLDEANVSCQDERRSRVHELLLAAGTGIVAEYAAIGLLRRQGLVESSAGDLRLTAAGTASARLLVRSHRLWEMYCYKYLDQPAHEVHFGAEQLEHVTDLGMQERLADSTDSPPEDPHGRQIPSLNHDHRSPTENA
jgi:manganese/zinc/iron transport system permease protein